jgi:hypothetical protein
MPGPSPLESEKLAGITGPLHTEGFDTDTIRIDTKPYHGTPYLGRLCHTGWQDQPACLV